MFHLKYNCFGFCCSLGCLFLSILVIFGIYFFRWITKSEPQPASPHVTDTQLKVLILSDSESDYENMDYLMRVVVPSESPDIVIHLGDITSLGVLEDFAKIEQIISPSNPPVNLVPGDRDLWKSKGPSNFTEIFGDNYYFKQVKGVGLLFIDNADEYKGLDEKQFEFIKENIKNADFVFLHNPIYFDSSLLGLIQKGMGRYSVNVDKQRLELLKIIRESNVRAVFGGDQHLFNHYSDKESEGLDFFIIGALSQSRNLDAPNYAILTVKDDGTYNVEKKYLRPADKNTSNNN